jgi:cobyrinic acid a,c-diamide synthase
MTAPGLLISAPRSGGGKTTVALGLMRALRRRGLAVAAAKCGPDYIDPAFHEAAIGCPSINLDSWAMAPSLMGDLARRAAEGSDLLVAEGAMGLFDGVPAPIGRSGSSADVAAAFGWPVLLVLDVGGQGQSAGAVAHGFASFDPRVAVAGVVLNRAGSARHRRLVTEGIERAGLPVLGALPTSPDIVLPERHLGLVQAEETAELSGRLDRLADFVEANADIERILGLARPSRFEPGALGGIAPPGQRIAVARDVAFSFLYPHLLQAWRDAGAEILFFSPLADDAPAPDCDICWLPGGYPELHAGRIAAAGRFLSGVRRFAEDRPVHGECGGYMVLGRALIDAEGVAHAMLGLLGLTTSFADRRMTLGYREAELLEDGPLGRRGDLWRGHEFHYATIADPGDDTAFARVRDAHGADPIPAGSRRGQVSGSFFHAVAPANP